MPVKSSAAAAKRIIREEESSGASDPDFEGSDNDAGTESDDSDAGVTESDSDGASKPPRANPKRKAAEASTKKGMAAASKKSKKDAAAGDDGEKEVEEVEEEEAEGGQHNPIVIRDFGANAVARVGEELALRGSSRYEADTARMVAEVMECLGLDSKDFQDPVDPLGLKAFEMRKELSQEQVRDIFPQMMDIDLYNRWRHVALMNLGLLDLWMNHCVDVEEKDAAGLPMRSRMAGLGFLTTKVLFVLVLDTLRTVECVFSAANVALSLIQIAQSQSDIDGVFGEDIFGSALEYSCIKAKDNVLTDAQDTHRRDETSNFFHTRSDCRAGGAKAGAQISKLYMDLKKSLSIGAANGCLANVLAAVAVYSHTGKASFPVIPSMDMGALKAADARKLKKVSVLELKRLLLQDLDNMVHLANRMIATLSVLATMPSRVGSGMNPFLVDQFVTWMNASRSEQEVVRIGLSLDPVCSLLACREVIRFQSSPDIAKRISEMLGLVLSPETQTIVVGQGLIDKAFQHEILAESQEVFFDNLKNFFEKVIVSQDVNVWPKHLFSADGVKKLADWYEQYVTVITAYNQAVDDEDDVEKAAQLKFIRKGLVVSNGRFKLKLFCRFGKSKEKDGHIVPIYHEPRLLLEMLRGKVLETIMAGRLATFHALSEAIRWFPSIHFWQFGGADVATVLGSLKLEEFSKKRIDETQACVLKLFVRNNNENYGNLTGESIAEEEAMGEEVEREGEEEEDQPGAEGAAGDEEDDE